MTDKTQSPSDAEIEALAIEHEAFGFGRADAKGFTTHGFDPDGVGNFARAVLAKWGTPQAVAGGYPVHQFRTYPCSDWYDGRADHSDGGGPYEERTLYTTPPPQAEREAATPQSPGHAREEQR